MADYGYNKLIHHYDQSMAHWRNQIIAKGPEACADFEAVLLELNRRPEDLRELPDDLVQCVVSLAWMAFEGLRQELHNPRGGQPSGDEEPDGV